MRLSFLLQEDVDKEVVKNYPVTIRVVKTAEEKVKNNITKPELFLGF